MKSQRIGKDMLKQKNDKDQDKKAIEPSKEIEDLKRKIEDLTYKWKRALADYQNLEKRIQQERKESVRYVAQRIIEKILYAVDSLEQAERHLKDEGLTLALKSLKDTLLGEGVKKIEVVGKKFNPIEMECVEIAEGDNDDIVIEELRPGFTLEDKILRVARVKVSKKKKESN